MVDMEKKTFELSDLDEDFWKKVIFINICWSSGMGGAGYLWFITEEKREYYTCPL